MAYRKRKNRRDFDIEVSSDEEPSVKPLVFTKESLNVQSDVEMSQDAHRNLRIRYEIQEDEAEIVDNFKASKDDGWSRFNVATPAAVPRARLKPKSAVPVMTRRGEIRVLINNVEMVEDEEPPAASMQTGDWSRFSVAKPTAEPRARVFQRTPVEPVIPQRDNLRRLNIETEIAEDEDSPTAVHPDVDWSNYSVAPLSTKPKPVQAVASKEDKMTRLNIDVDVAEDEDSPAAATTNTTVDWSRFNVVALPENGTAVPACTNQLTTTENEETSLLNTTIRSNFELSDIEDLDSASEVSDDDRPTDDDLENDEEKLDEYFAYELSDDEPTSDTKTDKLTVSKATRSDGVWFLEIEGDVRTVTLPISVLKNVNEGDTLTVVKGSGLEVIEKDWIYLVNPKVL